MPQMEAVQKDLERYQEWLEVHEERIRELEIWRAKIAGMMIAASMFGSMLGGGLVVAVQHYWK